MYYHLNILSRTKDMKTLEVDLKEKLFEEAKGIEEIRKPLLIELQRKECEIKRIKEYKESFRAGGSVPLRNLKQGSYTVNAAQKATSWYCPSYKLLNEDGDDTYTVWSNKCIADISEKINLKGDFLSLDG